MYKKQYIVVDEVIQQDTYATGSVFQGPSQRDLYISIDGEERSREAFGHLEVKTVAQALELARAYIDKELENAGEPE